MPDFETMDRIHHAVHWPKVGAGTRAQQYRGAPQQLMVRWVEARTDAVAADGHKVAADVTLLADRELQLGDFLWKGRLREFTEPADVFWVVWRGIYPDVKGRFTRYEYKLARYRSTLPSVDPG